MTEKDEILFYLKNNLVFLKQKFHIKRIGLFGSFARDEQKENSDIDLIIELEDNVENIYELKKELKNHLSKIFGRKIDIAREKYLKPYAKKYILKDVIYV